VKSFFALVNRNMRSFYLTSNCRKGLKGLEVFYKLVPTADIIVHVSESVS
jgi:crotonobetainyl-CoA:carnitine CoA-transferase CaiB-like acyl-CoA transferase